MANFEAPCEWCEFGQVLYQIIFSSLIINNKKSLAKTDGAIRHNVTNKGL